MIGVDPSGSDGENGDVIGMVAAGLGYDGRGYILEVGVENNGLALLLAWINEIIQQGCGSIQVQLGN